MGTNQPQQPQTPKTAEQINSPLMGAGFSHASLVFSHKPSIEFLESETDRLRFALERVVNLLRNAQPMMALEIAERALNPNQKNEHE